MKRLLSLFLAFAMVFSFCLLSTPLALAADTTSEAEVEESDVLTEEEEAELIAEDAWTALEDLGKIEAENGLIFVKITIPAELIDSEKTQADLDADAGEVYTSATLNEDGSITYKLTKAQHKAMLTEFADEIDASLQELVESSDYAFTKIEHNKDLTVFDATLSTYEVGFTEGFSTLIFYMYSGFYNLFTGLTPDNVQVNFYNPDGGLISTANSSDMQDLG